MIHFISVHLIGTIYDDVGINDFDDPLPAITEYKVCQNLNTILFKLFCHYYPNLLTAVAVDAISGSPVFEVTTFCCEDFKEGLFGVINPMNYF
jgi:hypothetical protein